MVKICLSNGPFNLVLAKHTQNKWIYLNLKNLPVKVPCYVLKCHNVVDVFLKAYSHFYLWTKEVLYWFSRLTWESIKGNILDKDLLHEGHKMEIYEGRHTSRPVVYSGTVAFKISEIPILNYVKAHTLMHILPHTLHLCIIKTTEIKGLKYILKVFFNIQISL